MGQLALFLLGIGGEPGKGEASSLQEADPVNTSKARGSEPRRERWSSDLPVVEEIIEPAEVAAAPEYWRFIGVEVSEQLDYEPAKFLRRRLVRRKYCRSMKLRFDTWLLVTGKPNSDTSGRRSRPAVDYALSNWDLLGAYLQDGRVEIDNNLVENAIRPTALGKKNWLFFGDADSGQRSAILYTIIECCRRRGINPFEYLRDVLTRLPFATNWTVAELTLENWQKNLAPAALSA